jgi:FtsH-binding integral membrane protein
VKTENRLRTKIKPAMGKLKEKIHVFSTEKAYSVGVSLISAGLMLSTTFAYADATSQLMEMIIDMICKLAIALGVIFAIVGGISLAAARSEGDGPAKNKAIGMLASGVMLAIMSAFILANKSTFVSIVTSA